MKVLFLGPGESPLVGWLRTVGEEVVAVSRRIDVAFLDAHAPDFIVSYGYRHILKRDMLDRMHGRAINLHVSYLPWNRGADPNLWSFIDETPKGVTIHHLDEGIDTGDIIVQKQLAFGETDTLRTSYDALQEEIRALFRESWADIRTGRCSRKEQRGGGTLHRLADRDRLSHLLTRGWDTPVRVLQEYGAEARISRRFWEKVEAEVERRPRVG